MLKLNRKIVERPQHILMRVAIDIRSEDINKVIETYYFMSKQYFVHVIHTTNTACADTQQMAR